MLYPLRFTPLFRRYLWGGRRLASRLNKPIGPEDDYAESWEIVDHGEDQSRVTDGPLAGWTLRELLESYPLDLCGPDHAKAPFPLLFKFLDAHRNLSVQVHPNDVEAAKLDPPDLGKTEAWVILAAEPGSKIYAGLKRGFDRDALAREVARGATELCLHQFEPRPGDCVFIPAGTVHALGAGLLVAEIQQSSDTTYRLFDWNRVGADGRPRQLHIEQSLQTIDYARGPVSPQTPVPTSRESVCNLVRCEKFVLDRWQFERPALMTDDSRSFHILAVLEGELLVDSDPVQSPLTKGQTLLVPASVSPSLELRPQGLVTLLDMYLP